MQGRDLAKVGGLLLALFAQGAPAAVLDAAPRAQGPSVPFIENRGQQDAQVAYYAPTFAGTVFATHGGEVVYALPAAHGGGWSLVERFVEGRAVPQAGEAAETTVSFVTGTGSAASVRTLRTVELGAVWPGVEVLLRADRNNVEKVFTLAPHAAVESIAIEMRGASSLQIDAGALVAVTGNGPVVFGAPVAFQELPSGRKPVAVTYRVDGLQYGFELGDYDAAHPVIIDPLIQSTYLGGTGTSFAREGVNDIAIHPTSGDVYVVGRADSADFPGTTGGAIASRPTGSVSAGFIARYNAELTTLLQATYVGGPGGQDVINRIVLTATEVYVAGSTESSAFPQTAGGAQPADPNAGTALNGFIARLPLSLASITQATYLGGTTAHDTVIHALLPHPNGDVYVCGETRSGSLPSANGFDDSNTASLRTAFITRANAALTAYSATTYFTDTGVLGSSGTVCQALAADANGGGVYAGGVSDSVNLPSVTGGALASGTSGAWLARFDATLSANSQSTWLAQPSSGSSPQVYGLRVHPANGDIYALTVAHAASAMPANATANGGQPTCSGTFQCLLLLRMNTALTSVVAGTFYGSPDTAAIVPRATNHLFIDPVSGDAFVVADGGAGLPNMSGGVQSSVPTGASTPSFVVRVRNDLGEITQASYLGGNGNTHATAVALHPANGDLYVAGQTSSSNFPGVTGGAQGAFAGNYDGFVARLTADLTASTAVNTGTLQFSAATYDADEGAGGVLITVTRTGGSSGAASVEYSTVDGTADADDDFTHVDGIVSWADGDDAPQSFTIAIADDAAAESDEYFNLVLTDAVGATLGAQSTAVVTIADNDTAAPEPGTVQFSAAAYGGSENGGAVTLTLTRTGGSSGAVDVTVATGGGTATAGSDYAALNAVVSWTDGDAADKTVNLVLLDDSLVEGSETIGVTLSAPTGGAALGAQSTATVTVTDNDSAPQPPPAQGGGGGGGGAIDLGWLALLAFGGLWSAAARRRRPDAGGK